MSAPSRDDSIEIAGFDPATGVVTDPAGRRVALLDPDGNWSVNAVAALFTQLSGGAHMMDALILISVAIRLRRGHLPPAVTDVVEGVRRDLAQVFFDAGGSLD